jgi:hypothetical protein
MYENLNENGRGKKNFKFNFILRKKEMCIKKREHVLKNAKVLFKIWF